jgi:hypothetical protein
MLIRLAALFSLALPACAQPVSFLVLSNGTQFAQKNNGPLVGLANPAHPGDYLSIYGTGLGNATPDQISVSIAGVPVPVTYAGPAPGEVGVTQINVYLPFGTAVPDSCSDAFTVTVAGASTKPIALPYTQSATSCPSLFGFNATELAAIEVGGQVNYVQLLLSSSTSLAGPMFFIRTESASATQLNSSVANAPLTFADTVFPSCQTQQPGRGVGFIAFGYSGLTLSMGDASIPINQPSAPFLIAPTPDAFAPSIFQPGIWQLSAPNLSQTFQLPPPLRLQNITALQSIDSTHDVTVTWDASGYSKSDFLALSITGLSCQAHATAGSLNILAAQLRPIPDSANLSAYIYSAQTPNFRLPQPDGSTLPLQVIYNFAEAFPVTLH